MSFSKQITRTGWQTLALVQRPDKRYTSQQSLATHKRTIATIEMNALFAAEACLQCGWPTIVAVALA